MIAQVGWGGMEWVQIFIWNGPEEEFSNMTSQCPPLLNDIKWESMDSEIWRKEQSRVGMFGVKE